MTDEELVKRLRDLDLYSADIAADRIEELIEARDTMGHLWAKEAADKQVALGRIEALTEQLEAARADAKEAEAYAEELEKRVAFVEEERRKTFQALLKVTKIHDEVEAKLATCEKYRDAYAECDRIGTQAVRDLEDKLAKAVEALGIIKDRQFYRMGPGITAQVIARATLAEIEGEKG
jgi:hypothetical protein